MPAWLGWLVVAAVLGVVEVTTLTFAAGLVACAALVAAVVAGVGGGLILQALVFGVTSFAALAVVYPICTRIRDKHTSSYRSGVEALLDRPAVVVKQVDAVSGVVRIGGEVWSARAYDETQVIAEGTRVSVFQIDGATALVYPKSLA
jgi:membrane protein implicated in regulation of membrane protease activity